MKLAGATLDFYDDPSGEVLRKMFPTASSLPAIVKSAHILSPEERDVLRDDAYALILHNDGQLIRKFACVDPGNTFLSALYYLENRDRLPEEIQKVAEEGILKFCEEFDLPISDLVKEAAKASRYGRSRRPDKHRQESTSSVDSRTNLRTPPDAPNSSMVEDALTQRKWASVVDVSSLEIAPQKKIASTKRFALGDRYPLDSYRDTQSAITYFLNNMQSFSPKDCHEYCVKTASRAEELGISVPEVISRYGSVEYSPDLYAHIEHRRSILNQESATLYGELLSKQAQLEPQVFAQFLSEIDELTGIDFHYPAIADPYLSTFGGNSKKEKLASWTWESPNGMSITAGDLQSLATSGTQALENTFTSDVVSAFQKDPVTIFDSMPTPQKLILARMATDGEYKTAAGSLPPALSMGGLAALTGIEGSQAFDKKKSKKERALAAGSAGATGAILAGEAMHNKGLLTKGFRKAKSFIPKVAAPVTPKGRVFDLSYSKSSLPYSLKLPSTAQPSLAKPPSTPPKPKFTVTNLRQAYQKAGVKPGLKSVTRLALK